MTPALHALLTGMPKAELHIHIEGSLEPELIFELARRNGVRLPYASVAQLRSAYVERAAADRVVHAELFFDPQTHTSRGVPMGAVIQGLHKACVQARAQHGIHAELILCFLRHLTEAEAFDTLDQALAYRHQFIGVGLDSSEKGHPPEKFARVFARCRDLGLRVVAHAGEEGPPDYIHRALDVLGAERIDHGVRAEQDPELMRRLAKEQIPLTVCPLSNVKLCVFDELSQHNLRRLLDAGLCVTINSDDPAYFGGYINDNLLQTFEALNLGPDHAIALARNSFKASFVDPALRDHWMQELDAFVRDGSVQHG